MTLADGQPFAIGGGAVPGGDVMRQQTRQLALGWWPQIAIVLIVVVAAGPAVDPPPLVVGSVGR